MYGVLLLLFGGVVGCHRASVHYAFTPNVAEGTANGDDKAVPGVRSFVTIHEIKPSSEKNVQTIRITFRVRVENNGTTEVRLRSNSFKLVSAELNEFGTPDVEPKKEKKWTVSPGDTSLLSVTFSLPEKTDTEERAFSWLKLSWAIEEGEKTYPYSATFNRAEPKRRHHDRYFRYHHYGYRGYRSPHYYGGFHARRYHGYHP